MMSIRNLSGREKVVLIGAVIAILYGVFEVVIRPNLDIDKTALLPSASGTPRNTSQYLENISLVMVSGELSKRERTILENVDKEWKNPFRRKVISSPAVKQKRQPPPPPTYTGFMEMDDRRLAVLGGMAYKEGERLLDSHYRVRRIHPKYVILTGRDMKTYKVALETEP